MLTRPEDLPGYREQFDLEKAEQAYAIASAIGESEALNTEIDYTILADAIKTALENPGINVSGISISAIAAAIKTALDAGVILDAATITTITAAINNSITRTPSFTLVTTTGAVAAGASSVAIANTGSAAGTALSTTLPAGATIEWRANGFDTLGAIAYDASGTEFLISEVR